MMRSSNALFPLAAAAIAAAALSGCVASRYQISDALMRYGLDGNQASCASEFLRGHLSTGQVDRLTRAARYYRPGSPLNLGDLVRVAGSIDDPQTMVQTGAAVLACKLGANIPIGRL